MSIKLLLLPSLSLSLFSRARALSLSKHTQTLHITDPQHIRINIPNSEFCPPLLHTDKKKYRIQNFAHTLFIQPNPLEGTLSNLAMPDLCFFFTFTFILLTAKPLEGTWSYRLNVKEGQVSFDTSRSLLTLGRNLVLSVERAKRLTDRQREREREREREQ